MIYGVYYMRSSALILLVAILLISTFPSMSLTLKSASTESGSHSINDISYQLKPLWETSINDSYGIWISTAEDLDNDGVNDILYSCYDSEGMYSMVAVNSWGDVIARLSLFNTSYYLLAIRYTDDVDGDGYIEVVLVYQNYGFQNDQTIYYFITWQPYGNKLLAQGSITLPSTNIMATTSTFIVEGSTAKLYAGKVEVSSTGLVLKTYVISYDVINGATSLTTVDGRIYTIYTNINVGDFDNDGIVEYSSKYKIISYTTFNIFPPGFISKIELYYNNNLMMSTTLPTNYIPIIATVNNNGSMDILQLGVVEYDTVNNVSKAHILAYTTNGVRLYDINLGINTFPFEGVADGKYTAVSYYNGQTNTTWLAIIDSGTGTVITNQDAGLTYLGRYLTLGKTLDGEYLVMYTNGTVWKVMEIPSLRTHNIINYYEFQDYATYIPVEISNNTYIPAYRQDGSNGVIGLYELSIYNGTDTTPPQIEILYPINNSLVPRKTSIKAFIRDPESGIAEINLTLIDVETQTETALNYTYNPYTGFLSAEVEFNKSGSYMVSLSAVNEFGLPSHAVVMFEVDADPPLISIIGFANNTIVTPDMLPLVIRFNIIDNYAISSWYVELNGETIMYNTTNAVFVNAGVSINRSQLVMGRNNVTIYAFDEAGNVAEKKIGFIYTALPAINITILNEHVLSRILKGNISLIIMFTGIYEINCTYYVEIDDQIIYSSQVVFNASIKVSINTLLFEDGEHDLRIAVVCNNISYVEYVGKIVIDNHPPKLEMILPPLKEGVINISHIKIVNGKAELTLKINISDLFLAWYAVYIDGELVINKTKLEAKSSSLQVLQDSVEEVTFLLDEGEHNITIVAADQAGNTNSSTSSIIIDLTPPAIESFTAETTESAITVYWSVKDNLSGVDRVLIVVNNEKYETTSATGSYVFSDLEPGTYTVQIIVYDKAGNNKSSAIQVELTPQTTDTTTTTTTPTQTTTTTSPITTTTTSETTTTPASNTTSTTQTAPQRGGIDSATIIIVAVIVIAGILGSAYMLKRR